jgi:hypothetical protein
LDGPTASVGTAFARAVFEDAAFAKTALAVAVFVVIACGTSVYAILAIIASQRSWYSPRGPGGVG